MISPHRDLLDIRQLYTLTKATFVMMMLMISNFHLHGTENHLDSPSSKHSYNNRTDFRVSISKTVDA
jgi:hypothetical protein